MPITPDPNLLTLSNTQAKDLAGRFVTVGGATYYFKGYDSGHPGQPPWRSGAEGKAYPLLGPDRRLAAYLKFFTRPTQKRLYRTAWLIGQQLHTWLPGLAAAPLLWTDTRQVIAGSAGSFHFAGYLAKAVPGETWLELKSRLVSGEIRLPEEFRWRCVRDLLLALSVCERAELVHGDLSPNNVIIDLNARPDAPALYLIDFDGFVTTAAGPNGVLTLAEGGAYGTEGYCPPHLSASAGAGDASVAPYSDRYGRDMLLLEFLLMDSSLPPENPPAGWDAEQLQRQYAAWRARSDPKCVQMLSHMDPANVFGLSELERPTSADLAVSLGLSLPERRVLRRVTEVPRPTPAILGCARASTKPERLSPLAERSHVSAEDSLQGFPDKPSLAQQLNLTDRQLLFCWIGAVIFVVMICVGVAFWAREGAVARGVADSPRESHAEYSSRYSPSTDGSMDRHSVPDRQDISEDIAEAALGGLCCFGCVALVIIATLAFGYAVTRHY